MKRKLGIAASCLILMLMGSHLYAAPTELLINGGFETGDFTGWTTVQSNHDQLTEWSVDSAGSDNYWHNTEPIEGVYDAYNGFDGEGGLSYYLFQSVTLPEVESLSLTTNHRIQYDSYGTDAELDRILRISIQNLTESDGLCLYEESIDIEAGDGYVD